MAYDPLKGLTYTPTTSSTAAANVYLPWASPAGSTGSKTDIQAAVARALAKEHPVGHHSAVGGFFSHLVKDVEDTASGFGPGLLQTIEHPVKTGNAIVDNYKQTYGPLVEGHYDKFLHNLYEHPLGPILDTLGVVTGGAGLGAKLGVLGKLGAPAVEGEAGLRVARLAKTDSFEDATPIGRYHINPVKRARQKAFDNLSRRVPGQTPFLGESARATRAIGRGNAAKLAGWEQIKASYVAIVRKLKDPSKDGGAEQTAYHQGLLGFSPKSRSDLLEGEADKGNATIERQTQKELQKHNDIVKQIDEHETKKDATATARSAPYMKKFAPVKVTKAELAAHEAITATGKAAAETLRASLEQARERRDKGLGKVTAKTTAAHDRKIAKLDAALKQKVIENGARRAPKDTPGGVKLTTHDTSKQALKTWEKERADLHNRLAEQKAKINTSQERKVEVDEYNKRFLNHPGAEKAFDEFQAAHHLAESAGYEHGARWETEKEIRDSELDEPEVTTKKGREAHIHWKKKHEALQQKLHDLGGSSPRLDSDVVMHALKKGGVSEQSMRLLQARDAADKIGHMDAKIRKLSSKDAKARRYMHIGLFHGVRMLPNAIVTFTKDGVESIGERQADDSIHLIRGEGKKNKPVTLTADEQKTLKNVAPPDAEKLLEDKSPFDRYTVARERWHPDGIDNITAKLEKDHIASGLADPVYFPDKVASEDERTGVKTTKRSQRRKGQIPQAARIKNHQNENVLAMAGAITSNPFALAQHVIPDIAVAHATDVAETLRSLARAHDGPIPDGFYGLKDMAVSRGFLNEYSKRFRDATAKDLKEGQIEGLKDSFVKAHLTQFDSEAGQAEGHTLIVSKHLVDALMPEYTKSMTFASRFYRNFSSVWKHMVLAGRPLPFVVNNVVGNSIMYALRHADVQGARALAFNKNFERMFEEMFPEHHLTHGDSHLISRPNGFQKALNWGYKTQGFHEHMLRRATMVAVARGSHEVRKAMEDLKEADGRYHPELHDNKEHLHAALERANHNAPGLKLEIGKAIDDTMGDYRHFSKAEEQLRRIMPFYSWTRHSTRAYLSLLMDRPLTAAMITALGQQGSKEQQKLLGDVPGFMKAYVPLGILKTLGIGSKKNMVGINTSVLNPEATVTDTLKTIGGIISGKPGENSSEIAGNLNPLITSVIEQVTGKSTLTGAPLKKDFTSNLGAFDIPTRIGEGLPIARLIASAIPADIPGSSSEGTGASFTPTGKLKKPHQQTIVNNFMSQLLGSVAAVPEKEWNKKGSAAWQKRLSSALTSSEYHVAKKRVRKASTTTSADGLTYKPK